MRYALAGIALWVLPAFAAPAFAQAPFAVAVETRLIDNFAIGSQQTIFGDLEFIGGFEIRSDEQVFGQLSALRFLAPGGAFVGVADHGYWFSGSIERNDQDMPVGIAGFTMQRMVGADGRILAEKHQSDAEGLDITNGIATVSFEHDARLCEFAFAPADGAILNMAKPLGCIDFLIPRHELRKNRGLETVAHAPDDGPLAGARIVVAERSIDADGNIFAAIIEGLQKGMFKVRRSGDFDITDGVFLPDGDLILLERRASLVSGVAMRLRRIKADTVRPGALVDGAVLMQADLTHRIDNMEAVDIWQRHDGATILSLLSDDNQSFLQRTLYLEFRLLP